MRRRFLVVFNADAGRSRRTLLDAVLADIRAADSTSEIAWCRSGTRDGVHAEIQAAAKSGAVDAVIAAGGDGTMRQVSAALSGHATPLGVVPLGTGNVLAHELAIPRCAAELGRMLRAGPVRCVAHAANRRLASSARCWRNK